MSKQPRPLSAKWVLFGALAIIAINTLLYAIFADSFTRADSGLYVIEQIEGEPRVTGVTSLYYLYFAIIAFGSFPVGGALIGWLSPGETIREPAIAASIAIVYNGVSSFFLQYGVPGFQPGSFVVGLLITAVAGYFLALGGAWLGEKLQGDTTEKMRERGELPPL